MKEADLFRQYSEEAVHSSSHAKSENEKQALMDLAYTWAQAALMSERVLGVKLCFAAAQTGAEGNSPCLLTFL
jgi:hypothetical protein